MSNPTEQQQDSLHDGAAKLWVGTTHEPIQRDGRSLYEYQVSDGPAGKRSTSADFDNAAEALMHAARHARTIVVEDDFQPVDCHAEALGAVVRELLAQLHAGEIADHFKRATLLRAEQLSGYTYDPHQCPECGATTHRCETGECRHCDNEACGWSGFCPGD